MVDVLGHLGMALLWLSPAWLIIDRPKTAATFVATGFWFGMLPDTDLVLSSLFPQAIHHHGVFHTVLIVTILAAILGPIVGWIWTAALGGSDWFSPEAEDRASALGFAAVWVASLSHIFADMLSAPDISSRIEPLWPLFDGPLVYVDVLYYQSFWATWALLILGVVVNAALGAWVMRRERRESVPRPK